MDNICLFGASGHGLVVKDIAFSQDVTIVAFFDDNSEINYVNEIPVFSKNKLNNYLDNSFLISIGNNKIRKEISLKIDVVFTTLIHKMATIASSVTISEGTVIMAGAIINAESKIGKHVIINTSAIVEHDCFIDDFVHISPNATLTGNVSVGIGTHIGAGSVIIPNIKIGKWVTIGAGSVVIENIPDKAVVVGNPGKIIRYNN